MTKTESARFIFLLAAFKVARFVWNFYGDSFGECPVFCIKFMRDYFT